MKKSFIFLVLLFGVSIINPAEAHPRYYHGSCSSCVYVVRSDYSQQEQSFNGCKDHYLLTERTVNFYSNGTRRVFYNHIVYNADGSVFLDNCTDIKHIIHNKTHYFLARRNGIYSIITGDGDLISKRRYTYMYEASPNRLLVRVDKKYGIIDLKDDIIVPIKYKKFEQLEANLFMTKLNGYWGMIDASNNQILKNEYDKIKPLYDTYMLKKEGKYGLADINGKMILPACNDSIKKLGEYIVVKNDKNYYVYDASGKKISDLAYKKVRLERNTLEGYLKGEKWVEIL